MPDPPPRTSREPGDGGRYTLGDTDLAGDRLAVLAEVFDPTTRALVRDGRPTVVVTAVDLGCGPGHTTRLLADEVPGAAVVGLDASAAFVDRARREADRPGVRFGVHDAREVPFPTPPPDLVLARYLLSHLPDPAAVVDRWTAHVAPGGRVLVDEVAAIDTTVDAFATYLDVSGRMIAAQGADLYVGGALPAATTSSGATVVLDRTVRVAPATATVARLFAMNLTTWRHDPWVVEHIDRSVIDRLAADLVALEASPTEGEIVWRQRQVAYASGR